MPYFGPRPHSLAGAAYVWRTPLGTEQRAGGLIQARPHAPVGQADQQGCCGDRPAPRDLQKWTLASVAARSVTSASSAADVSELGKVRYSAVKKSGVPEPYGVILGGLDTYDRYSLGWYLGGWF